MLKEYLYRIGLGSALLITFLLAAQYAHAASILITNSSDSLTTFRTNVNTSLTNLNTDRLSTSTTPTIGNLPYFSGLNTLADVATGTLSCSSPLSCTSRSVIGGSSAITLDTSGTWSGNAVTATALAANGSNCSLGQAAGGVDASGNAEDCTAYSTFSWPFPSNATSTLLSFLGGLTSYASSTIGDGTAAGGLTISGNATTTRNAYVAGTSAIGTSSPFAKLSVHANPTDTSIKTILFAIGSSTASATTTLFSVGNQGNTSVAGTFAVTGATTLTGALTVNNVIQTSSTAGAANFATGSGTSISNSTAVGTTFLGASNSNYRAYEHGTTLTTLTASATYANHLIGYTGATEAASGNHPLLAQLVILPLFVTSGVATVTDTAGLYIDSAATTTVSGGNYAVLVNSGTSLFRDKLSVGSSTPFAFFSLHATSTSGLGSPTTLFAIGSSTRGTSTTTLFSVDNVGSITTAITGSTQCLHVNSTGIISGTGSDCGSGSGSSASSTLLSDSNTWTNTNKFQSILPRTDATYTLGSGTFGWSQINLSANSSLFWNGNLDLTNSGTKLTLTAGATFVATYASTTQLTSGTNTFYVDGSGNVTGKDTSTGNSGLLSPNHHLTLSTGTTTAWTASSSGAYTPLAVATFSGTLKFSKCYLDQSFLGVEIDINGTPVAPSYFVASSTVGTTTITGSNTFKTGDRISAKFGTTTTASTLQAACTIDAIQTS